MIHVPMAHANPNKTPLAVHPIRQEGTTGDEGTTADTQDSAHTPQLRLTLNLTSVSLALVDSTPAGAHDARAAGGGHVPGAGPVPPPSPPTPAKVVMLASMEALETEFTSFPSTMRVRVRVGAAGVASPYGQLFQAGQLGADRCGGKGGRTKSDLPTGK